VVREGRVGLKMFQSQGREGASHLSRNHLPGQGRRVEGLLRAAVERGHNLSSIVPERLKALVGEAGNTLAPDSRRVQLPNDHDAEPVHDRCDLGSPTDNPDSLIETYSVRPIEFALELDRNDRLKEQQRLKKRKRTT